MRFVCKYHFHGTILRKFEAAGVIVEICGIYDNSGKPWVPDLSSVAAAMPFNLRPAVMRSQAWVSVYSQAKPDVLHIPLTGKRGKPLGSIYATAVT